MRVGTIYYDHELDQTVIKWNEDFLGQHRITILDALKDASYMVDLMYNKTLENKEITK